MKTIFLYLSTFFAIQNCQQESIKILPQSKLPTPIKTIYFQRWTGGQELTGSGINFYISFKNALDKNNTLKKIYFDNQEALFEKRNDTVYTAVIFIKRNVPENMQNNMRKNDDNITPKNKNNYKLGNNEAIITINQKGKNVLYKLTDIDENEYLAYPSAPPRR